MSVCSGKHAGNNDGCPWPVVPSADTKLCARHLLIAAEDAKQIGADVLVKIVRQEEARA